MKAELTINQLKEKVEREGLIKALYSVYGSAVKVKILFTDAVCKLRIEELNLSVRGYNCLKRVGVNYVEDLIGKIETSDLYSIRNLGRKTIAEIKTTLLEFVYNSLPESEKLTFLQAVIADNDAN